jgi:two-component system, NtrC family, sensor kinase
VGETLRRRSRASGKEDKAGGRKAEMPKRHTTPVVHRPGSSNASPETEATRLRHELHEALEQQAATAGVLKLIISSFGDPQLVFANILASANRICGADGGVLHLVATHNMPQTLIELSPASQSVVASKIVIEPGRGSVLGRAAIEAKPVQVADVLADPEYTLHEAQRKVGYRTVLGVPLLRDGHPIGVISLMRLTVRPFTDKQIEIVQNFADQAVVAVENTRLIAELRQRTDQLARSVTELQRERNNKLMNLEAMVASISHEVGQPLASIATSGSAALRFLKHMPPNLEEVQSALNRIIGDCHRAGQVFDNLRALFGKAEKGHEPH